MLSGVKASTAFIFNDNPSTHRWTSHTEAKKNMEMVFHYYASAVKGREKIFHNFVDFHFIFGTRASQRILLVRDENKKSIAQPSVLSLIFPFLIKSEHTHTHEKNYFSFSHIQRGVVWGGRRSEGKILRDDAIFMKRRARKKVSMMVVAELYVPAIYLNPCHVIRNFNLTVEAVRIQRMTDAVKYTFYLLYRFVARLIVNYWTNAPWMEKIMRFSRPSSHNSKFAKFSATKV